MDGSVGEAVIPEGMTLMEIKIPGVMPLWMAQILSDMQIYPTSFSKYGAYYMQHPELYMRAVENHRQFFDTNNDVVAIEAIRDRKKHTLHKAGI